MEEVKTIYAPEVIDYLNQLTLVLFKKDYFSYFENAVNYKDKIIDFIDSNIAVFPSKKSPIELLYLGENYIFYKSNQRTTWFIFFDNVGDNYLISSIINSHSEEVKWL